MNVVVLTKLTPSEDENARIDEHTKRLERAGQPTLDDADTYGVELALRLVEAAGGGEVTTLSMTPDADAAAVRTALAMGAARAVVVCDEALAGSDALGTAKVLAAALRRLSPDLVLAGTESTDGYTGTVPVQVAELLGVPSVSFARHVELHDGGLLIHRQTESGYEEVVAPFPAVVSVTAGAVEVRYPSIRGVMAAKSKPFELWTLEDLGVKSSTVGTLGSRQEVVDVVPAESRSGGHIVVDSGDAELQIIEFLETVKAL